MRKLNINNAIGHLSHCLSSKLAYFTMLESGADFAGGPKFPRWPHFPSEGVASFSIAGGLLSYLHGVQQGACHLSAAHITGQQCSPRDNGVYEGVNSYSNL
jgi:hypothetical protein